MSERLDNWLAGRNPEPHPRLLARMRDAARQVENADSSVADLARAASVRLLQAVLDSPPSERGGSTALDLLAADALMTYSCEAACEEPATLGKVASGNIEAVVELINRNTHAGQRQN